ncbi:hypothetical protein RRG08_065246 [Elysia crispata]|uniref:Uncharacterized protein n=1 Tax=Elysia crispata TaxID=231223 RepID=A0AAE1CZL7_9GAST|nr:hypothetical protein RRG08_065246 [Elysia crispata]
MVTRGLEADQEQKIPAGRSQLTSHGGIQLETLIACHEVSCEGGDHHTRTWEYQTGTRDHLVSTINGGKETPMSANHGAHTRDGKNSCSAVRTLGVRSFA